MTDASAPCALCGGTGFVIQEGKGGTRARPCACRAVAGTARGAGALLEQARIPQRYRECGFETFYATGPKREQILSLEKARTLATRYVEEYPLNECTGLLFMGPPGVGKTHLAVAAMRRLALEKGVACLFCDVQDLLRRLQATFDRHSGLSELDLLQPVISSEVVLLDDLGGRQCSPWVEETLAHIVTTRYNERRATIVTTNYLDEPRDSRDPVLADRIGHRVRSRLHEMCYLVRVEAQDFRQMVHRADHHRARLDRPAERT